MAVNQLRAVLLWSSALNALVLAVWVIVAIGPHATLERVIQRLFGVSSAQFNLFNFYGISTYKCFILFFNLIPWIALTLAGWD